jgi:t-SNARE complex subunit (syntaxin)
MPEDLKNPQNVAYAKATTDHGPQYLRAARNGGIIGGLIGALITMIVCFVCHYVIGI